MTKKKTAAESKASEESFDIQMKLDADEYQARIEALQKDPFFRQLQEVHKNLHISNGIILDAIIMLKLEIDTLKGAK